MLSDSDNDIPVKERPAIEYSIRILCHPSQCKFQGAEHEPAQNAHLANTKTSEHITSSVFPLVTLSKMLPRHHSSNGYPRSKSDKETYSISPHR